MVACAMQMVELSGRMKVWAVLASVVFFVLGELWRRYGFHLLTVERQELENLKAKAVRKPPLDVALSSASSKLRKENEGMDECAGMSEMQKKRHYLLNPHPM